MGSEFDGGYIVPKKIIDHSDVLLSFGVGADICFEMDFLEHNKEVKLICLDGSTSPKFVLKEITKHLYDHILNFIANGIRLKFSGDFCHKIYTTLGYLGFYKDFKRVTQNRRCTYINQFISNKSEGKCISVDDLFGKSILQKSERIFVKMDIEGYEYLTLWYFRPHFERISGFVVEFHDLGLQWPHFIPMTDMLFESFDLVHIHGNNWAHNIPETSIPETLELTFVHKRYRDANVCPNTNTYPMPGLDAPCNPKYPDLKLTFE